MLMRDSYSESDNLKVGNLKFAAARRRRRAGAIKRLMRRVLRLSTPRADPGASALQSKMAPARAARRVTEASDE